jgi:GntR family transcriptional regulator/MocR family aminotransferase
VTVAYDRLAGDGFVVARVGDGTFVNPHAVRGREGSRRRQTDGVLRPRHLWQAVPLPTAFHQPAPFEFRTGHPDASLFPHTTWRRLVARTLRDASRTATSYGDPAGDIALRDAIAQHVSRSRGMIATAEDVTITNGTQQALDVLARVLLSPSDRVAVEDPGYNPPRRLFHSLGARVVAVEVDTEGVVVEAIPRQVRAIYVTPSHQYPTGVVMTLPRRQTLLAWAERQDAAIIEDDYDSEFRFTDRPLEPLRTLDTAGRVVYVGSFSKTLLPGLRLGFIIAPRSLQPAIHRAKFLTDWHSPTFLQAALARFIEEGNFASHLRRVNRVYRERHEMVAAALARDFADDLELIPSTTGLHMAALARSASVERIEAIARRAFAAGAAIQTLAYFSASGRPRAGIVLGYGAIPTDHIPEGLRRVRNCFRGSAKH